MPVGIMRAEVRIGCHSISRSGYGIMPMGIMRAEVRIGSHNISRSG